MQKFLKAVLSVILAVTVVFCTLCFSPISFAANSSVKFALATDIHIETGRQELEHNYPESELYFHASGSGNLYDEAAGLLNAFLKQAAEQNVDFVLIPGDMTRRGSTEEHEFVAARLEAFEAETGIKVYVIPGNHDYFNSTPDEFKEYYKNVCYNDVLEVDSETASYTAELPNGYRLIAVDSNDPGNSGDGMTERLYGWIEQQATRANEDGRKIIYTMHHGLLGHLPLGKLLMTDFVVADSDKVAESFARMGITHVFTGHEHGNDIAQYTASNGTVVYDILTTSLSSYPLEYRMVTADENGFSLEMQSIDECDFEALIDGYNDSQLELMRSDYGAYAYGYFKYAIEKKIFRYISPEFIKGKLKINDGLLADELDALLGLVSEALYMPINDNGDGGKSIAGLAAKKGVTIPETEYSSLCDLVTTLVAKHYYGDENMPSKDSPEAELFVKGLNTGLEYILSNAGRESLKALLKISDGVLPEAVLGRWIASVGTESSYDVAEAVLYPILDVFTVDKAPSDRNADLPYVTEKADNLKTVKNIFDIIMKIAKYILNVVIAIIK